MHRAFGNYTWISCGATAYLLWVAPLSPQKIYQLEPNDRQRKRRQRTSETVAGIVPYESSLAEHGLKFPEARGRQLPTTLPDI